MTASNAITAHGTQLKRANAAYPSTAAYTVVGEVKSINGISVQRDFAETTHMQSGGWKEFLPINSEIGEITLDVSFIPTEDTQDFTVGLGKDLVDGVKRYFQLIFPDSGATTWLIPAYVKSVTPTMQQNAPLGATIVLRPSGVPTLV